MRLFVNLLSVLKAHSRIVSALVLLLLLLLFWSFWTFLSLLLNLSVKTLIYPRCVFPSHLSCWECVFWVLVSDEARLEAKDSDSRGRSRHLISAEKTQREADLASKLPCQWKPFANNSCSSWSWCDETAWKWNLHLHRWSCIFKHSFSRVTLALRAVFFFLLSPRFSQPSLVFPMIYLAGADPLSFISCLQHLTHTMERLIKYGRKSQQ